MRGLRLWPRSLAWRTALTVLIGLAFVQVAGLTIHALDRIDLQRLGQMRDLGNRMGGIYRVVASTAPPQREQALADLTLPQGYAASLSASPPTADLDPMPVPLQRMLRATLSTTPLAGLTRPREYALRGGYAWRRVAVGMRLPDGIWLDVTAELEPPRPWHSATFLMAFILMTVAAALLILWAVRRMVAPVRALAEHAEALGRDVMAPALSEHGPTETVMAARAFNTMATRVRRFVQDRTEMLTAIGHDLRTPITRLKLRAEFVEDDELRRKMLADLEELEAMVSATLAFGRDAQSAEPVSPIDLAELLRTILDEAGDAAPSAAEKLSYDGPRHLTIRVRPLALKRALANLVSNAVKYGGGASVHLAGAADPNAAPLVRIDVDDDGPGIPAEHIDRVFEPFYRVEGSRNRDTGGVGLGLPISRNILRGLGGDVIIVNRPMGGARASVTLPA